MEQIILKMRESIVRNGLIAEGDRILLSLSAGKDSMFLFHSMKLLSAECGFAIGIFHLNHQTRGAESDRDEEHIRKLAKIHDTPVYIERFDFAGNRICGKSFEEQARDMRYKLAGRISAAHEYDKIATGHNRNDNIETVLMRIFTGTGIYGMRGIKVQRNNIIRPLLALTADEIYAYLADHEIRWLEDSSNTDASHTRNFIRHQILPLLRSRFPTVDESVYALSGLSADAVQLLESFVEEKYPSLYEVSGDDLYVDADLLIHNYPLFCHAVSAGIRKFFNQHSNRKMLDELYAKYSINRSNISLYKNNAIRIDKVYTANRSRLKISTNTHPGQLPSKWEYRFDISELRRKQGLYLAEIGIHITIEIVDYVYFEKFNKNNRYVFVTLENEIKSIYIRNRRTGDRINTETGTKKIKDLLIEKKLDNESKNRVPLLVAGSKVIACMPGFLFEISNRVAADFLIDKNAGKVLAVYKN